MKFPLYIQGIELYEKKSLVTVFPNNMYLSETLITTE